MQLDKIIAVRNTKTIYRDCSSCVKVFNEDYSKADVLNEALNQSKVEETGLNIPKLIKVTTVNGKWAIESEFIAGKTLAQLMEEDPSGKDKYIEMLVDIQLEIQSKRNPDLNKLKSKLSRKISESSLDATTRYELHTMLESMPKHDKICHGDLNPSNIIITEEGTPFIIDWAHATQGNASADAARTYLLFMVSGDEDGAEKYLDTFCRKSDTAEQYVQKWMPIVAASLLSKSSSKEKEFLMKCINVVDYE